MSQLSRSNSDKPLKRSLIDPQTGQLDLSHLPQETQNHLIAKYTENQIKLDEKLQKAQIDNAILNQRLSQQTDTVREATQAEAAVTLTGTYEDELGRTEVMMGNTDRARKGKLDRTQKGLTDYSFMYFAAAAIVLIILANILG